MNELATLEPAPVATPSAMSILNLAVGGGASIETIERLVALQERMMAHDAKQAWATAMSRCQSDMGRVSADAENPQTRSKYATYAAIDREIRPVYSREGFALSFTTQDMDSEKILVLCHVSHAQGHTETFSVPMPADGKGAKGGDVMTKTHATGAAMSYGMRYLLKMIFNIAVGEDDRDGNGFGMNAAQIKAHLAAIQEAKDIPALQQAYEKAQREARKDKASLTEIIKAKDARKAALLGGAK